MWKKQLRIIAITAVLCVCYQATSTAAQFDEVASREDESPPSPPAFPIGAFNQIENQISTLENERDTMDRTNTAKNQEMLNRLKDLEKILSELGSAQAEYENFTMMEKCVSQLRIYRNVDEAVKIIVMYKITDKYTIQTITSHAFNQNKVNYDVVLRFCNQLPNIQLSLYALGQLKTECDSIRYPMNFDATSFDLVKNHMINSFDGHSFNALLAATLYEVRPTAVISLLKKMMSDLQKNVFYKGNSHWFAQLMLVLQSNYNVIKASRCDTKLFEKERTHLLKLQSYLMILRLTHSSDVDILKLADDFQPIIRTYLTNTDLLAELEQCK